MEKNLFNPEDKSPNRVRIWLERQIFKRLMTPEQWHYYKWETPEYLVEYQNQIADFNARILSPIRMIDYRAVPGLNQ